MLGNRSMTVLLALAWLLLLFLLDIDIYQRRLVLREELPVEPILGLGLLAIAVRWRGSAGGWPPLIIGSVITLVALPRIVDAVALAFFGRPLDYLWDLQHATRVTALFQESLPGLLVFGAIGAVALLILLGWLLTLAATKRMGRCFSGPVWPSLAILSLALLAFANAQAWPGQLPRLASTHASNIIAYKVNEAWTWFFEKDAALASLKAERQGLGDPAAGLPGLAGHNLLLIFVESYGAGLLEHPDTSTAAEALLRQAEVELSDEGFAFASGELLSPTVGGRSWLAHLSLTGGVFLTSNFLYRTFLESGEAVLADFMAQTGHRTVLYMPGIQGVWPESKQMRFDRRYLAADIPYKGPAFGWFILPDQVILERVFEQELEHAEKPVFAQIALLSSHIPFHPVPPLLEEIQRLDDRKAWEQAVKREASFAEPNWGDWPAMYLKAASYTLSSVFDFIRRAAGEGSLVILLGDHQPPSFVSWGHGGARVPIHFISRDPDLIKPLLGLGYEPGLLPTRPAEGDAEALPMSRVLGQLIAAFGANAEAAPAVAERKCHGVSSTC
jgi:hypothetical protein